MRLKPYTQIGIRRLKCFRCGAKAEYQWQICSDGNQYRPLCAECDIELNELVLRWIGFKETDHMMERYKERMRSLNE